MFFSTSYNKKNFWSNCEFVGKPPREQCCEDEGVSQECLVLCRKDPDIVGSGSSDSFPSDTPCEKHKSAINKCSKAGILFQFLDKATRYNLRNIKM